MRKDNDQHVMFSFVLHTGLLYFVIYLYYFTDFDWSDLGSVFPVMLWFSIGLSFATFLRPKLFKKLPYIASFFVAPLLLLWPVLIPFKRWS